MTDEQVATIRQRWRDGRYAYFSRDVGDPLRGVQQDGDADVDGLMETLGAVASAAETRADEAEAEAARLWAALGFYADEANWRRTRYLHVTDPKDRFIFRLADGDGDGYDIARAALARTEPAGG